MKEVIKAGFIGIGRRGSRMLELSLSKMNDVDIVMICDKNPENLAVGRDILVRAGRREPAVTSDYRDMLKCDELDAVFIFTGWDGRLAIAKEFMKRGVYTAIEVGCAENIEDCFEVVDIYERVGAPLMMLENICYDRRELMALNMIKQGLFGEVVHCSGGYCHNLNEVELFKEMTKQGKDDVTHYRLGHYINESSENYPTHELGPISKCLGINRGNRMLTLSSFSSKSVGLKSYARDTFGADSKYASIDYKCGDIVNTVITCAGGETILLTLDTTLPRSCYSRQFSIRGTKGMCNEERGVFYLDGMEENIQNNEDEMFEKYGHPISKEVKANEPVAVRIKSTFGLHDGGVDWIIFRAFIESVKRGINTPIDTYDTASWLAIGPLSAESIRRGSAPVEVPDFTKGKWQSREPAVRSKYCLDEVIVDDSVKIYGCVDLDKY